MTIYPFITVFSIFFFGPAGIGWSTFIIVQASVQISSMVMTLLVMPDIEKLVFDSILSKEFNDDLVLVSKLRRIKQIPVLVAFTNFLFNVPNWLIIPYFVLRASVIFLFGLVPLIGPLAIAYIKAPTRGLQAHARYFKLKGYDTKEIREVYKQNKSDYRGFGLIANLLESIPFLNLFFMFTDTIGAALWVAKIEHGLKVMRTEAESLFKPSKKEPIEDCQMKERLPDELDALVNEENVPISRSGSPIDIDDVNTTDL